MAGWLESHAKPKRKQFKPNQVNDGMAESGAKGWMASQMGDSHASGTHMEPDEDDESPSMYGKSKKPKGFMARLAQRESM